MTKRTAAVAGVGCPCSNQDYGYLAIDGESVGDVALAEKAGCDVVYDEIGRAFSRALDDAEDAALMAAAPQPQGEYSTAWRESLSGADTERLMDASAARSRIDHRAEYRAETGRAFPRGYKLRIVVEAEEVSDEEARAWWQARAATEAVERAEIEARLDAHDAVRRADAARAADVSAREAAARK